MKTKRTKKLLSFCLILGFLLTTPRVLDASCSEAKWFCEMDAYWDYLYQVDDCYFFLLGCKNWATTIYYYSLSTCNYEYIACIYADY